MEEDIGAFFYKNSNFTQAEAADKGLLANYCARVLAIQYEDEYFLPNIELHEPIIGYIDRQS